MSVCLSTCKLENAAILRQKRNNSARLPQFLNLTTSKTQQFCETSSIFEVDNIKNETILRDLLQKWKVKCRADGLVPMRFAIFPLHLSKALSLPRKSEARSYEVLHLSPEDLMLQNATPVRKSAPGPPHSSDEHLLHCACHGKCIFAILCRSSSNVPRLPSFLEMLQNPHVLLTFLTRCPIPCACHAKRRFNVQKWREHVALCTFWLRNVLRATTAYNFWTSQLPKVLWTRQFFTLLISKCASRHNGVQVFISHLASWLRTRCFSEPTFRPSGATNHWKNTVFRDFPTFSRTWIFFLLRLSLFWSSFFFSSLLWLFPSLLFICPYCRKFDF